MRSSRGRKRGSSGAGFGTTRRPLWRDAPGHRHLAEIRARADDACSAPERSVPRAPQARDWRATVDRLERVHVAVVEAPAARALVRLVRRQLDTSGRRASGGTRARSGRSCSWRRRRPRRGARRAIVAATAACRTPTGRRRETQSTRYGSGAGAASAVVTTSTAWPCPRRKSATLGRVARRAADVRRPDAADDQDVHARPPRRVRPPLDRARAGRRPDERRRRPSRRARPRRRRSRPTPRRARGRAGSSRPTRSRGRGRAGSAGRSRPGATSTSRRRTGAPPAIEHEPRGVGRAGVVGAVQHPDEPRHEHEDRRDHDRHQQRRADRVPPNACEHRIASRRAPSRASAR